MPMFKLPTGPRPSQTRSWGVHDALCRQHWRLRSGSTADVFPRKAKLLEG